MDQKKTKESIGLILAFLFFFCLFWYCSHTGHKSQPSSNARELEAIKLVQQYGTEKSNILKTISTIIALGKNTSNYKIEVIGWSAYQKAANPSAEIYQVSFAVKEGEKDVTYEWEADLITKNVYALNKMADDIMKIVTAYK